MKHNSIYQKWLINKTFATGQRVILVNSRNDHSIVQRPLICAPWVILTSEALGLLKKKVLKRPLHYIVILKCSRGFFVQKLFDNLLIMIQMMYESNKMVPGRMPLDVHSEISATYFRVRLFLCEAIMGGLHVVKFKSM